MALNLEDKKALVAEVTEVAAKAQSVVAAEYRGLTVAQMTELRAQGAQAGVYMRVVKNTLARKALAGTAFESVGPKLKGPLVLAFSKDDPGAAARVVKEFAKATTSSWRRSCLSAGRCCPANELEKVASLPTREQALSKLLGVLQGADPEVRRARSPRRTAKLARTARRCPRPESRPRALNCRVKNLFRSTEMAVNKDEILDAISKMTVMEVVELITDMEKKFGVTAAAPVAVAAGGRAAPPLPLRPRRRPSSP